MNKNLGLPGGEANNDRNWIMIAGKRWEEEQ